MATYRKRTGPRGTRWQVQVRLQGAGSRSATFDTKAEAVEWARDIEGDAKNRLGGGDRRPLSEAIERYSRTVMPRKAASTRRTQKDRLKWWHDKLGDVQLRNITPDLIARIRDEIEESSSGPTANRALAVLSHVLTVASREWGWIRDNPCRRVTRCPENPPRVRFLEPKETERLLAECRKISPALHTFVVVALTTAMRRGEISSLRWSQVDLQRRVIHLDMTKNKERRSIPISDQLFEELRTLQRYVHTDLLFPNPNAEGRPNSFRYDFDRAIEKAGIEDFRFHDLRHTVASYLAMNGATERELAEILGHNTMAMVRRYSHLSTEHVAGLLGRVSSALVPSADASGKHS